MYPVFIYTLNCPVTGIVRYCGQTANPDERLCDHIKNARKKKYHNARWIKKLLSKNLRPVMEILDVVPDNEADFWEMEYIQNFKERGFYMTNATPGGVGVGLGRGADHPNFGKSPSLLTRAKMSVAGKGKKNSPSHCAAISAGKKGKKHSPQHVENNRLARIGLRPSPEACAKNSASHLGEKNHFFGKHHKPASIEKLKAYARENHHYFGKELPPEHCKNISLALNGQKNKKNTSGFVGVSELYGKWGARFTFEGRRIYVGYFAKIEDAVFARALAVALQ